MFSELNILLEQLTGLCPDIRSAIEENRLVAMESGSRSPCLDLRRIDAKLANQSQDVDLVVLEGMGRCIHTNYNAQFTCDSLKLAVIKNRWLANRCGGDMYSVVCQYSKGTKTT
ncbi:4'-phosphopantetheine phosphatase-like [Actinia tenebrosa]|uniref:4'-phosphopantetheine phosphatase-like n=1 Tax=Actinia tenebrosa TaxID=6105 RepID=A0A6P8H8C1_ACTTE|nr:4'-phosphopantetheine phosphatase-like [Actinia tenebrosa]